MDYSVELTTAQKLFLQIRVMKFCHFSNKTLKRISQVILTFIKLTNQQKTGPHNVQLQKLLWGKDLDSFVESHGQFDMIVASDVMYA